MTRPCGFRLLIALWLALAGVLAAGQQDTGTTSGAAAQSPLVPAVEGHKSPAENENFPDRKKNGGPAASTAKTANKSRSDSPAADPKVARHKTADSKPEDGPRKIVVRQGGASEPPTQIAPGMTPAEATRQRQNTEQLLEATGDQLQMLSERTLDQNRQETVGQIRNFMNGARAALQEGDLRRANTLAEKAHLLSDDLLKH